MTWRKKLDPKSNNVGKAFANWLSQLCMMILPKNLFMVAGRGSSKTTDILVERLIEMAFDMPGAPVVWVSDTYANLQKNVLRTVMEGLSMKGCHEDVHYVVGKAPPEFNEAEKADIPKNIREHFWKPHNQIASYKNTFIFFTGLNLTFASLDRPASLAGNNYVHVFGDEAKYFREDRVSNLLKSLRGYKLKYGNSVFYRGRTFTTDMPDINKIGQYDWILKQGKRMKASAITLVLKLAMIVNESANEYLAACEELEANSQQPKAKNQSRETAIKKHRTWQRWVERWTLSRLHKDAHTFFYIASSYVNADILTPEYFKEAYEEDFADNKSSILSMAPKLEAGDMFYANLQERHFFRDGIDEKKAILFGIRDNEDCRILKYLDTNKPLNGGADFGNMISLVISQEFKNGREERALKFIYTLSPEWIRHIADKFTQYFKPHKNKTLHLYYDRAANNYADTGEDLASNIKQCIEVDEKGQKTGWKVQLMSVGEGNIGQNEEYHFMQELLGETNPKLPKIKIDFYNCKPLRCSLEDAKTRKNTKDQIIKDKSSEKLPIHRLPLESTNPSDAWKYLMMRKSLRKLVSGRRKQYTGTAGTL
ncbi:MAG: hypothetical protein ABJG41_01375 [Cyclobacteriaceae bacterium]